MDEAGAPSCPEGRVLWGVMPVHMVHV